LSGFKVLDVTHYMAGPYCTRLLAGYGAEVIKVEPPGIGDGARRLGPFVGDDPHIDKSELFLYLNTGKKSITLNLKSPAGVEIFKRLVQEADILVENFEPRVMPSLGLDYESLSGLNPKLVMTSISSFGQTGPYRDYKAAEIVEYALSGLMKMTGEPDREPLKLGLDAAQFTGGQAAVPPMLAAVYAAQSTNRGRHVDVSIMDYCVGIAEWQLGLYDAIGHITPRMGNFNQKGHPWGVFPCKDGWVVIATYGGSFKYLAELTDVDELKDPKFLDHGMRVANSDEVDLHLLPWLLEHEKKFWIENAFELLNTKRGAAAGWVRNTEDLVNCPHLRKRGMMLEIDDPIAGKRVFAKSPFRMTNVMEVPAKTAPDLGEHTESTLKELLQYDEKKIQELRKEKVI